MAVLQKLSSFHQFNRPKLCGPLTPLNIQIFTCSVKPRKHHPSFQVSSSLDYSKHHDYNRKLVQEFDPKITIEEAVTPPSSWYTDPSFYTHELNQVFFKGWQAVGYTEQIKEPRQYFTGRLGNVEYVICRDDGGKIHAFHNVCRHHASLLASGSGKSSCFVCPYHGWTYGLDGALLKATRITGIKNFKEMGLVPMRVAVWGPFILLNFDNGVLPEEESDFDLVGNEWLGNSSQILADGGVDSSLSFLCRREYTIECNWKVFCDNYLDGGYHVPYAHKGLASGLTLDSYSTTMLEKVSIQRCETGSADKDQEFDRLGSKALYAFVYPNFMINRYGPWMDTNLVLPQGPRKCLVIFDYFLDASLKFEASVPFCGFSQFLAFYKMYKEDRHRVLWFRNQQQEEECTRCNSTSGGLGRGDESFIAQSLEDSETVQMEDIKLCEAVQRGLESPAYCSGRYAPQVEKAMHHFHCLLYENLSN